MRDIEYIYKQNTHNLIGTIESFLWKSFKWIKNQQSLPFGWLVVEQKSTTNHPNGCCSSLGSYSKRAKATICNDNKL